MGIQGSYSKIKLSCSLLGNSWMVGVDDIHTGIDDV